MKYLLIMLLVLNSLYLSADLIEEYELKLDEIDGPRFSLPIALDAAWNGNVVRGQVLGRLDHPLEAVADLLRNPDAWCDALFLHLNTKGCLYRKTESEDIITLYFGRKCNQLLTGAVPLALKFNVEINSEDGISVLLLADKGPAGTSNYSIHFEAVPYDQTTTIGKLTFSTQYGGFFKSVINVYLRLFSSRSGFPKTDAGETETAKGLEAAIERNAVRYYLALVSQLSATCSGLNQEQSWGLWFDATTEFPQLCEYSKAEYLRNKQLEINAQRAFVSVGNKRVTRGIFWWVKQIFNRCEDCPDNLMNLPPNQLGAGARRCDTPLATPSCQNPALCNFPIALGTRPAQ